ncbi:MAG: 2-succinyl-5-enolpyruvyl-6-hydroxy-3-cyclohexene-1-carboxylic-acid synthase [Bdellovibrionaceae bacterium]|nr:2-succinyl-5-enolpyruvyl-6-hydroxy-3-cyclohexene-1-carboxylic-acid synthase [Pseudobdellovibrionaceae bacterium]
MSAPLRNIDLVKTVLQTLKNLRVHDVIVCAGARNIPLVQGLDWQVEHANTKDGFRITSYFEERSAAFYALGKAKATGSPVAIVTTSGTAVAELFPAIIEAYYQDVPLIIITADRPKPYRGSGAPQAIDQAHLFQKYVEASLDWDIFQTDFSFNCTGKKPIHFNICFDEPLIDGDYAIAKATEVKIQRTPVDPQSVPTVTCLNPLVIISEIRQSERPMMVDFIKQHNLFFYPEFLSGLMNHDELKMYQLNNLEGFADLQQKYGFQSIIRIGGVPTQRLWRDLESKYADLPVSNFSERKFSGLARASNSYSLAKLDSVQIVHQVQASFIHQRNQQLEILKQDALKKHANSEPAFIQKLSQVVKQAPLYIGNSLPIREWDLFSSSIQNEQLVFANRGANGIDGQISSYLGWSAQLSVSWCLVGDLTALYHLPALGLAQGDRNKKRIVVMNNSGGKIFNRLFGDKKYLNSQAVDFSGWAKLWGWDYMCITSQNELDQLQSLNSNRIIIELVPDNKQSDLFWVEWDFACNH